MGYYKVIESANQGNIISNLVPPRIKSYYILDFGQLGMGFGEYWGIRIAA